MFVSVHSDGPGHLQRAAGRRGSVRFALWRECAQRCSGRGPVLVSRLSPRRHAQTVRPSQPVLNVYRAFEVAASLRETAKVMCCVSIGL